MNYYSINIAKKLNKIYNLYIMDPIIKSVLNKTYNTDKEDTTRPKNYFHMNNMDNNKKIVIVILRYYPFI